MEFHRLGQTDLLVSRLGFGCGPASGHDYGPIDESEWRTSVHFALDHGINFFDVANVYGFGHAEELLADALGPHRESCIIATKGGLRWDDQHRVHRDSSSTAIAASIDASLSRLRISCIPLYQLHWPDPQTPLEETFAALAHAQQQGKIKHIGVSNFPLPLLHQALRLARIESLQIAFNLLSREPELEIFPWCESNHISVLAHTALARGALSEKRAHSSAADFTDTRNVSPYFSAEAAPIRGALLTALRTISSKNGRPASSVALRWILDDARITSALVGVRNTSQLNQNLTSLGWKLTPVERQSLSEISAQSPPGLKGIPAHGSAQS
jgi:aryl-alcohol dehydrogenase-like predicted oxidoreductase